MNSRCIHIRIGAQNIRPCPVRHRHNRIRIQHRRPFHPRRHRIPRSQLLRLPRPQGLQGVRRQNKRHSVELLGQKSRHGRVPGMRVHNIDRTQQFHRHKIQRKRIHRRLELRLRPSRHLWWRHVAAHMQITGILFLRAPAMHLNFNLPRQFSRKIFDMHPSPAIHIRRILPCHQSNSHLTLSWRVRRSPRIEVYTKSKGQFPEDWPLPKIRWAFANENAGVARTASREALCYKTFSKSRIKTIVRINDKPPPP